LKVSKQFCTHNQSKYLELSYQLMIFKTILYIINQNMQNYNYEYFDWFYVKSCFESSTHHHLTFLNIMIWF